MTVDTKLTYTNEYIEQFSQDRNEPEWMKTLRLEALEQVEHLDMPEPDKTKIVRWNFTRFHHDFVSGENISSLDHLPEEIKDFFDQDNLPENLLIQRNHSIAHAALSKELKEKGVIFTDIFTAMNEHSELVKKYYMKDGVAVDEHRLTALHATLMNGGIFVYVPKNVQIEEPLQVVFWQEKPGLAYFNHVIVVAEQNSSLNYVENYISNSEEETVANIVTEVFANDNAKISFGAVDNFAENTTVYTNRRGIAKRDATINWAIGQMNDGNTIFENITELVGDNSLSHANTVTVGRGKLIQNITAKTIHWGKNSEGYILQHGVMKDSASNVFNGIGKIENGASGSNAEQTSRVLMLSEKARGDANPILLIEEDDVMAGHAASVGKVDPMQMYYLMSRGITRKEAERLIIHGFLEPVVAELPLESVKKQLKQVIERKIN